jgi:hypothetical protein
MTLWSRLIDMSVEIENLFDTYLERDDVSTEDFNFHGWSDKFWRSSEVRKCHMKIIDRREDKNLWLMHINIFPRSNVLLPILGFDIVSGPSKITGAFLDYSSPQNHPYLDYLEMKSKSLRWKKEREIPNWGKLIFSSDIIAAGNIREGEELDQLLETTYDLTKNYVENIGSNSFVTEIDQTDYHNLYCLQQKKNPHLHNSILNLGISIEDKDRYINEVLFEEV